MDTLQDPPRAGRSTLELVWDEGLNATAMTDCGTSIRVGPAASLSPQHLLALAASSCFMTTLLGLASDAGVSIEGYVSSARIRETSTGAPSLALAPCIVVTSDKDRMAMEDLYRRAVEQSSVCALLGRLVEIEPEIRVVPPE